MQFTDGNICNPTKSQIITMGRKSQIDLIRVEADVRRFVQHAGSISDQTLLILKGHLLIEELVRQLIDQQLQHPEFLRTTKFEFDQCLALCRALTGTNVRDWVWTAAKKLNVLRNSLAHNLEPKGLNDRIKDFTEYVLQHWRESVQSEDSVPRIDSELYAALTCVHVGLVTELHRARESNLKWAIDLLIEYKAIDPALGKKLLEIEIDKPR